MIVFEKDVFKVVAIEVDPSLVKVSGCQIFTLFHQHL